MPNKPPETLIGAAIVAAMARSAAEARKRRAADETDLKENEALKELETVKTKTKADRIKKDHDRSEQLKDAVNNTLIWVFRVVAWGVVGLGGVWAIHLVIPVWAHWLTSAQLTTIHNIFTGGIVSSILIEHFRRKL